MRPTRHIHINPAERLPLLRDQKSTDEAPRELRVSKTHTHPISSPSSTPKSTEASISFIGTATTILEWQGLRILTDPNFLHEGDHVHLGPGVTATRLTDPSVVLDQLPPLDLVLLSHYHEDHFDRVVEGSLNRDFMVVTTPHAKGCLTDAGRYDDQDGHGGVFRNVVDVDHFESLVVHIHGKHEDDGKAKVPVVKITGMPGKHVPPGPLAVANDLLGAVPPTNGWLLEMGWAPSSKPEPSSSAGVEASLTSTDIAAKEGSQSTETGYRIYISGDTLFVDELKEIPKYIREQRLLQQQHSSSASSPTSQDDGKIDLMIMHLGGTTIPGPKMPLLMVTMDAKQGVQLMKLMRPDLTIPVHFDDYSVMVSPLSDFRKEVEGLGEEWEGRVVYLDRGEAFRFWVRG